MTSIPRFDPIKSVGDFAAHKGTLRSQLFVALPPKMIQPILEAEVRQVGRRRRIWELSNQLHCSIVGTCLATADLRQILVKAKVVLDGASEHDLHRQGVALAGQHDGLGKLLHKTLDRLHRTMVSRFDKAGTVDAVRSLWREAVSQGDIPGAYWAAMTHPATNDALIREIFGDVHMLSHLVGAANRADIRRLSALEAENAALHDKLARQQDHLRDGITRRDAKIRELGDALARRIAEQPAAADVASDAAALTDLVASLEQRLRRETNRNAALEERLARTNEELGRERTKRSGLVRSEAALREELGAVEASFRPQDEPASAAAAPASLSGLTLLYVGGRSVGHLRALSERLGASFLHHDGGIEDRSGLLGGLVSRADIVLFPVDCISHEAVTNLKRLCRQMAKPFMPLRSSGMGSFAAALFKPRA
jgi:Uncharacterized protein conserved in bacteria (DUF2325)